MITLLHRASHVFKLLILAFLKKSMGEMNGNLTFRNGAGFEVVELHWQINISEDSFGFVLKAVVQFKAVIQFISIQFQ